MNNYNTPNNSTDEKSDLLSGQKITLDEVKKLVNATNQAQRLYDEARDKRNRGIVQYLKQSKANNAVHALSYELRVNPCILYNIVSRSKDKKDIVRAYKWGDKLRKNKGGSAHE